MTITYPLILPATPGPAEVEWGAQTVGGKNVSPYTLGPETFEWPGNRWRVSVRYPPMMRAQGDPLIAALLSLYGVGTFKFGPVGPGGTPKGTAAGSPVVNGANQTGKSLITDGWNVSQAEVLKAGDFFSVVGGSQDRLHMVVITGSADAGGNATLDLWPRIRISPADNEQIILTNPKGIFRLAGPEPKWDVDVAYIYGLNFEAEEVL